MIVLFEEYLKSKESIPKCKIFVFAIIWNEIEWRFILNNFSYMNTLINILVSALAVALAAYITPGASVDGYLTAIIVAVVLAVVNGTIGVLLKILTFPINILTLGLVSIIINVLMVLLVAKLVPGFKVDGFWIALVFAVILALVNMVLGGGIIRQ